MNVCLSTIRRKVGHGRSWRLCNTSEMTLGRVLGLVLGILFDFGNRGRVMVAKASKVPTSHVALTLRRQSTYCYPYPYLLTRMTPMYAACNAGSSSG